MKAVEDMKTRLQASEAKFEAVWGTMKYILEYIRGDDDNNELVADAVSYAPYIPSRFYTFVKDSFRRCINNLLCRVRVLAPNAQLERLGDLDEPEDFLRQVSECEDSLAPLVEQVVDNLELGSEPVTPLLAPVVPPFEPDVSAP